MGLFSKKADPIQSKAKALNDQIAALEVEIKKLQKKSSHPDSATLAQPAPQPLVRSNQFAQPQLQSQVQPQAQAQAPRTAAARASAGTREPIFESVDQASPAIATEKDAHYNDLGVRKYDLGAAWRRLKRALNGPSTHNPKLVSYLAAGSIRGLRPLRYEKRIARNRFIALTLFFVVILWSVLGLLFSHR
jgi:hypothetical protein